MLNQLYTIVCIQRKTSTNDPNIPEFAMGGIKMSDYLVWAGEKLEQKYGWKLEDAMEYLMSGNYIPHDVSLEMYLAERRKERAQL